MTTNETKTEKPKHSHQGHRQRFKNKALEMGIDHWPAHEVMELILMYCIPQKDVNPLAHTLIEQFGSISGVLNAGYEQLKKVNGIAHESALFLSILPDIFKRYEASLNTDTVILNTTQQCVQYFRHNYRIKDMEDFYIFCLDAKKRLIKKIVMDGTMASSINVPLTSFASNIAFKGNRSIVVIHTHPGGNTQPTEADITATRRLISASYAVGVVLDDHIIISNDEYYSFLKEGDRDRLVNEYIKTMNTNDKPLKSFNNITNPPAQDK